MMAKCGFQKSTGLVHMTLSFTRTFWTVDIDTSMAKVNVLKTSGSGEQSSASYRSKGMESYFKIKGKTVEALNPDAETFVPHNLGKDEKRKPVTGNAD